MSIGDFSKSVFNETLQQLNRRKAQGTHKIAADFGKQFQPLFLQLACASA